jgi:trimeric autotransporter adhesin
MEKTARTRLWVGCMAVAVMVGMASSARAQTIGTSISIDGALPNTNAMLDVQSPSIGAGKGLLIPRVTANQRTNESAALAGGLRDDSGDLRGGVAQGLMIYQTDATEGLYYNTSTNATPIWFFAGGGGDFKSDGSVPMTGPLTSSSTISADQLFNTNNTAAGFNAVALGGTANSASSAGSVIAGGSNNTIIGTASTIGGGWSNVAGNAASDQFIVIGGGDRNAVTDHHSTIGGGRENRISQEYSTIAGGYSNLIDNTYAFIGGGRFNWIRARDNVIGGGGHNLIDSGDIFSVVGGGESNKIYNDRCFIGGGRGNLASNIYVTIGGGDLNFARGDSATIGGGWTNRIESADAAVISGGRGNKIYSNCDYSSIPGGRGNIITNSADYAFAGGYGAHALHDGVFLWADHNTSPRLYSTAENQFMVRASGGYIFYSANNATTGAQLPAGSGSWSSLSDRNAKRALEPLDGREILDSLSGIPMYSWQYKDQAEEIRHVGPMAQDLYAAFGFGEDERHISSIDADGLALSAIQELYSLTRQENEELRSVIQAQEAALEAIQARLSQMEESLK